MNMTEQLAILIDSYDGMSDVWKYFFQIFDRFWPDCPYRRYLITNNLDFKSVGDIRVIKTGEDKNWFTMTYKGLSEVNAKYVFFMIEDDFISKKADEHALLEIINYMDKNDIFFYRFTCPLNFPKDQGFLSVPGDVIYPISVQPAIWRKDKLLGFISELQKEGCVSPWDFERYFIKKYEGNDKNDIIPGIRYDSRRLFGFRNGIIQGKWDPRIVKMYRKLGINIDTTQRGVMPFKKVALDQIKRSKLLRSLSFKKQLKLKEFLRKLGVDFVT